MSSNRDKWAAHPAIREKFPLYMAQGLTQQQAGHKIANELGLSYAYVYRVGCLHEVITKGGVHAGKLTADQRQEIKRKIKAGNVVLRQLAKEYGVSPAAINKYAREVECESRSASPSSQQEAKQCI